MLSTRNRHGSLSKATGTKSSGQGIWTTGFSIREDEMTKENDEAYIFFFFLLYLYSKGISRISIDAFFRKISRTIMILRKESRRYLRHNIYKKSTDRNSNHLKKKKNSVHLIRFKYINILFIRN